MPIKRLKRHIAAALMLTALAGCGSSASVSSTHRGTGTGHARPLPPTTSLTVSISGYSYHPAQLTVRPGVRITFINHDATAHTATSKTLAFDTGTLAPGASRTITLVKPGTYAFYCQFHPFMHAVLVVRN